MAKEIKIDETIIKDVTKLRNDVSKIMFDFGNLKLERINLEQRISDIDKIESDSGYKASKEDIKYFKSTFENILFNKNFL